ncbi:helix-turn-helix domain-containing protein [Anaerotruncus colihominis]|uniref:helix-turn-helix domain-containing protein n=1 Tax=Anaerotruncus colihominis TaxID=169435 RepID=UPI002432E3ED|nr:helix-turn-helix domain-containing protein [Anaerotruncus colihominis]
MKNRKNNLLPYETIVMAAAGEPEAVNTVIQTYTGYIKYLSCFQGGINDDIQVYLKASLIEALPKFGFDG